jgi:hypothetical protein
MLDIEYIDSMRPSKVARAPPIEEDDEDAEPLESDDEEEKQALLAEEADRLKELEGGYDVVDDGGGGGDAGKRRRRNRGKGQLGSDDGSIRSITSGRGGSFDSQGSGGGGGGGHHKSKRQSRFDEKVTRGSEFEKQASKRLSRQGSSFRKSMIQLTGPQAALAAADARQRAKEKKALMIAEELKKKKQAEKNNAAFKFPAITLPRMLTPSKKKGKKATTAEESDPPSHKEQFALDNKAFSSGSSVSSDVNFDLKF